MYAKFVTYEGNRCQEIFEGDHLKYYKKHFVNNAEYRVWHNNTFDEQSAWPLCINDIPTGTSDGKGKIEVIFLEIHCSGQLVKKVISFPNSSLFIMNDLGDTVDRLVAKKL